jgi:hypothetical protein
MDTTRPAAQSAVLVCRYLEQHGGKEYRFTREWSEETLAFAHPRHVAVRCPGCGWAWFVSFEQWNK